MFNLITTQGLVDRELADAKKEVTRYRQRIDNAEALAREELGKEYAPQIESLSAEVEALRAERDNEHSRIQKLAVAVSVGVPLKKASDFADLITGTNPDEYKASAERLLALFRRI